MGKMFQGGGETFDEGYCVQQTTDGGFIITGYTMYKAKDKDLYLVKTDGSGGLQWDQIFGGNSDDVGYSVWQTTDGGYIISGYSGSDAWLIKTDSEGIMQWDKTFSGYLKGNSVQQTTDGGYILGCNYRIIKTNTSGNLQWEQSFGGNSVQQTTDGGYIIVGGDLIKTDASGNKQWEEPNISGKQVQQTEDGGYIIVGGSNDIVLTYYSTCNVNIIEGSLFLSYPGGEGCTPTIAQLNQENIDCSGTIYWESSNQKVAVVSSSGLVTAKGVGNAEITAYCSSEIYCADKCEVTVEPCPCSVDITEQSLLLSLPGNIEGCPKKTHRLKADNNCVGNILWFSSDQDVASVDNTGNVTAIGEGNAVITAYCYLDPDCEDTCQVQVQICEECEIDITQDEVELSYPSGPGCPPKEFQLDFTLLSDCIGGSILWSSSDTSVAEVTSLGKVIAIDAGQSTIIAKCSLDQYCNDTCSVTVNLCGSGECYIDISEDTVELSYPGGGTCPPTTYQLNQTYGNCSGDILWSSSDETVAIVNQYTGLVTAQDVDQEETAIITAYCSDDTGCKDTCQVIVEPCPTDCPLAHSGDVDSNGEVLPDDALDALRIYLEVYDENLECAEENADICPAGGDNFVDPSDAIGIIRKYLSIVPYCP